MRYLVAGGAGYAGGHIRDALLALGHQVVSLDIAADKTRHARLTVEQADITDAEEVHRVFQQNGPFDVVFHCASRSSLALSHKKENEAVNTRAVKYIAEACAHFGTPQLVMLSSHQVYAPGETLPIAENTISVPRCEFGRQKLAAEAGLWQYQGCLNSVILRVPPLVGFGRPGMNALLFDLLREGRKVPVFGNGNQRRQLLWIDDLVDAALRASTYPRTAVFNLGAATIPTQKEMLLSLIFESGQNASLVSVSPRLLRLLCHFSEEGKNIVNALQYSYIGDITAATRELGWQPTRDNTEMMLAAYNDHLEKWRAYRRQNAAVRHKQSGTSLLPPTVGQLLRMAG